ncbi:MAG: DUF3352 domain-containing protein [Candidatus Aminicenantes bacterium]|nr:DUF3352 domain-containing protein [Candidatus Aminicenantes bacterium]
MRKTTTVFLAFLMAAIFSPKISGESIQTKLVPAEAKWLIHIDVEKFAKTELKQILEKNSDHDFSREIMGIEKKTGIDFFSDISSVTVIGMNLENSDPVVAISGSLDKSQLLDLIKEEESGVEIKYGSFILYNWDNDGFGVFADDNLLIISENRSGLEKVLDTFSGKEKDFSNTPLQRQLKTLSPGTFLVAAAENVSELLDEDDDDFGALILKKTESAFFSVNEKNSKVKLQLDLQTDSPETATNMENMVTGLKAFLSMNDKIDPNWDIIKSLKVSAKGTTVVLESEGSMEELLNILMKKK